MSRRDGESVVLTPYNGKLNSNEIYQWIYNMIISQTVFASPIKGTYSLADKFRKEGGLFGDTKLFYSVQIGNVENWGNDAEAVNLLALKRPKDPYCQAVTIDVFKKIWLTVDNFLSKRAWGDEGAFSQFNSVILATMRDTKRVYEATMMNTFIGNHYATRPDQTVSVTISDASKEAQTVAKAIADLIVDVKDINKKYNDLGYLRSYSEDELTFVVSSEWYNKITKLDLPTIFHNDGLLDKLGENVIPARYFGRVLVTSGASTDIGADKYIKSNGEVAKAGVRSLVHKVFTFEGNEVVIFPGDQLAIGMKVDYTGGSVSNPDFDEAEIYIEDANVICKIVVAEGIQYMSAFETQTEFYNPRSLTNNHYLIFGHSDLNKSVLKEFPFITVKKA